MLPGGFMVTRFLLLAALLTLGACASVQGDRDPASAGPQDPAHEKHGQFYRDAAF
jgi:hypothetical protein